LADDGHVDIAGDVNHLGSSAVLLLGSAELNPSVLILSEEVTFLLSCYAALHQDARVGQVEAATSREEAARLLLTFQPDVVVIDWSAGNGNGLGVVVDQCRLSPGTRIVVSCDACDGQVVAPHARAIGAVGLLRRESVTAAAIVRAHHGPEGRGARTSGAVTAS
jgi:chemotaxis response regulator CheB